MNYKSNILLKYNLSGDIIATDPSNREGDVPTVTYLTLIPSDIGKK